MNTKKNQILFISLVMLIFSFTTALAEDENTEVLVVIKPNEILAFMGPKNEWVSKSLTQNERNIKKRSSGNVAVVVTNERIFGFSVIQEKWDVISLLMNESPKEIQAEGNVATVMTGQRIFGFSAHAGNWVEAK